MSKKITIECTQDEMILIERALELYSRVALCQFDNLDLCYSLSKEISRLEIMHEFENKSDELKELFGLIKNSYWGIFNKENVHDDARIAAHLHQIIRHERYKERIASGEQIKNHHTVDEYPADICQIAGIETPKFKMNYETKIN